VGIFRQNEYFFKGFDSLEDQNTSLSSLKMSSKKMMVV
jgi:hypothetical protein